MCAVRSSPHHRSTDFACVLVARRKMTGEESIAAGRDARFQLIPAGPYLSDLLFSPFSFRDSLSRSVASFLHSAACAFERRESELNGHLDTRIPGNGQAKASRTTDTSTLGNSGRTCSSSRPMLASFSLTVFSADFAFATATHLSTSAL